VRAFRRGLFAALATKTIERLSGPSLPASFGIATDFQGFGAGGSKPNTPLGVVPSLGVSIIAGLSLDMTNASKVDQPDPRAPH